MALFRKSKKEKTAASRRRRHSGKEPVGRRLLEKNSLAAGALFLLFNAAVILVCFVGLSPVGQHPLLNQVSRIRVVSDLQFSYESPVLTDQARREAAETVPPVYVPDRAPYRRFETYLSRLALTLDALGAETEGLSRPERLAVIERFKLEFEPESGFNPNAEDIDTILVEMNSDTRTKSLQEGLLVLRNLFDGGIYDARQTVASGASRSLNLFHIARGTGPLSKAEVHSQEEALYTLRISLLALSINREAAGALFRVLSGGLEPNLIHNKEKTAQIRAQVAAAVPPVVQEIRVGETLIEPGSRVSQLEEEKLHAFRAERRDRAAGGVLQDEHLGERILLTLTTFLGIAVFLKACRVEFRRSGRKIALCGVVILVNLALVRTIMEIADSEVLGEITPVLLAVLPYVVPTALGALAVALLIGAGPAAVVALSVCVLNALMHDNAIAGLLTTLLSTLVAIGAARRVQVRARVMRAGLAAGMTLAFFALLLGIYQVLEVEVIARQMLAAVAAGLVTGIAAVGSLPLMERVFGYTTDITLLELTDTNHPLLRRLQIHAPGTYHHSLMVANLSERAAHDAGGNPLVCRVCSLYHDIGKLVKPEYFSENQRQGINPHIYQNPSMSALVIKSHVKEGLNLAKEYHLPSPITNVIREHHGTTLIQYFYYKALKKQKSTAPIFPNTPSIELDPVNESTYRYEGPKPQFRESAIIFLADSVEAASRSLPKVTPQAIDELLEKIFSARLDDHQLSECPLTFAELDKIRRSFSFTLLNQLHSRVEYPSEQEKEEVRGKDKGRDKEREREKGKRTKEKEKEKEKEKGRKRGGTPAPAPADEPSDPQPARKVPPAAGRPAGQDEFGPVAHVPQRRSQ